MERKIFFGAAIQGVARLGERGAVYRQILAAIREAGHRVYSEHSSGENLPEVLRLMEQTMGPLPTDPDQRRPLVRDHLIHWLENEADAAVFELSTPSLGTGIEFAHAYLRPKLGLPPIPILALYQENFWPNGLSTMVVGLSATHY